MSAEELEELLAQKKARTEAAPAAPAGGGWSGVGARVTARVGEAVVGAASSVAKDLISF